MLHDWRVEVEEFAARGHQYAVACAVAEAAVRLEFWRSDLELGTPEFYRQVLGAARFIVNDTLGCE